MKIKIDYYKIATTCFLIAITIGMIGLNLERDNMNEQWIWKYTVKIKASGAAGDLGIQILPSPQQIIKDFTIIYEVISGDGGGSATFIYYYTDTPTTFVKILDGYTGTTLYIPNNDLVATFAGVNIRDLILLSGDKLYVGRTAKAVNGVDQIEIRATLSTYALPTVTVIAGTIDTSYFNEIVAVI